MECFGDSSSSDESDGGGGDGGGVANAAAAAITRDEASCGVCAFHPHTEASLLAHCRNALAASSTRAPDPRRARLERAATVLAAVDEFCASRHWMMHVGPEKGRILAGALRDAVRGQRERAAAAESGGGPSRAASFVAVELGTYCGYAALLMARAFLEARQAEEEEEDASPDQMAFRLHTTEIDGRYADVARDMIRLGGMDDVIAVHHINYDGHDTDVDAVLRRALRRTSPPGGDGGTEETTVATAAIDLLFLDHDKDAYAPDLRRLEAAGLVRRGTVVVADNVLFAGIRDYVAYVRQRQGEGVVETTTIPCSVEYSGAGGEDDATRYRDGVGELAPRGARVYLASIVSMQV